MERKCEVRIEEITEKFKLCHKALLAIGDETRQLILLTLLNRDLNGIRVGEITLKTHLSRPAVSHHLQILKDAEIVNMRREGTRNYTLSGYQAGCYYLDANESRWKILSELVCLIYSGIQHIGEDDPRKGQDL